MKTHAIAAALLLACGLCAQVDASGSGGKAKAAYEKLVADYKVETDSYMAELKKLTATDAYKKAVENRDSKALGEIRKGIKAPDAKSFSERALKEADQYSGEGRVPFLIWVLQNGGKEFGKQAADVLIKDHADSKALQPLVESGSRVLGSLGEAGGREFLAAVAAKNENPEIKAYAIYWPAFMGLRAKDLTDEQKAGYEASIAQARKLADGTLLADRIDAPKFIEEHLQVGMEAPDINGADVDGVAFKLSDYRGKVVVLDFWGFW